MSAIQLGGSWRATFVALGAQVAVLTGAWLGPAGIGIVPLVPETLPLIAAGWLALIGGLIVWAKQTGATQRSQVITFSALALIPIAGSVAIGFFVLIAIGINNRLCDPSSFGWLLVVVAYFGFGLLARYGGRWMPLLFPLAVAASIAVFIAFGFAAGTTCGD